MFQTSFPDGRKRNLVLLAGSIGSILVECVASRSRFGLTDETSEIFFGTRVGQIVKDRKSAWEVSGRRSDLGRAVESGEASY